MKYVKGQFVAFPEMLRLDELKIKYSDAIVYLAVRSFNGSRGCFPGYEAIAKRAGCSRDYVIKAIKRMEVKRILIVQRSGKLHESNKYTFYNNINILSDRFEKIPYQIFFEKLTVYESSALILIRQFVNTHLFGGFTCSIRTIATKLGISYKQLYNPLKSLISKGYISYKVEKRLGKTYRFTSKIEWGFNLGNSINTKPVDTVLKIG